MSLTGYYGFPSQPFTLVSGRVISDPENTPATREDCLPYMCGADNSNDAALFWCAYHGQHGALAGCVDPQCIDFRSLIPYCQVRADAGMPSGPAPTNLPTLTPQNIVQPLPDITVTMRPEPVATLQDTMWCNLNNAINTYPLVAIGALAALAVILWPKKGGRR